MTKEDLRKKIVAMIEGGSEKDKVYFSDIASQFDLGLEETVRICEELIDEGKICIEEGVQKKT